MNGPLDLRTECNSERANETNTRKKAPSTEQKHSHKYTDNNEVENAKPETGDRTEPRSEP